MSRFRYVKGKITKITGGDYNIYSRNGNINFSAAKKVNFEGVEEGELYTNNPVFPEPINLTNIGIVRTAYFAIKEEILNGNNTEIHYRRIGNNTEQYNQIPLCSKIYAVVETSGLRNREIYLNVRTGRTDVLGEGLNSNLNLNGILRFSAQVGDISTTTNFSNRNNYQDIAVFEIDIRPREINDVRRWERLIENSTDRGLYLYMIVDAHSPNEDYEITYQNGRNPNADGSPNMQSLPNAYLDLDLRFLKVVNRETYYIYHEDAMTDNHRIERIENQQATIARYLYIDENGRRHNVCECDLSTVRRRNNGQTIANVPPRHIRRERLPEEGDAEYNYHYENGDIVTTGSNYGIKRYTPANGNVQLIRMPDNLNINNNGVIINYTFHDTMRRYCNPGCFAGFIGALAECGFNDIECTGMCFGDATSYPSVTHPNGDSVDTRYLNTLQRQQRFVDGLHNYYFTNILRGNASWYPNLNHTRYSNGHNDHLHAGDFDINEVHILNN